MIGKMLGSVWTHLQIAFNDNYTVDGFERTSKKFELPASLAELDPISKRKMTICNLFANQNLSISAIVKVLDSSLHQVVPALIDNGLIKERRRNRRTGGPESQKPDRNVPLSILPDRTNVGPATGESVSRSETAKAFSSVDGSSKTVPADVVNSAQQASHNILEL